jgi:hypothetical protein
LNSIYTLTPVRIPGKSLTISGLLHTHVNHIFTHKSVDGLRECVSVQIYLSRKPLTKKMWSQESSKKREEDEEGTETTIQLILHSNSLKRSKRGKLDNN